LSDDRSGRESSRELRSAEVPRFPLRETLVREGIMERRELSSERRRMAAGGEAAMVAVFGTLVLG